MAAVIEGASSGDIEFSDVDLHFARTMAALAGGEASALTAAAALASRATGNGDICVQLEDFAARALPSLELTTPPVEAWISALRASAVVATPGEFRPLVLDDSGRLYLYRYWHYEQRLADDLLARAADVDHLDETLLRAGLKRHFPDPRDAEQKLAAATAVLRRLCVISGGPGTGKTTTVVKILALLAEQAQGRRLAIAVAAPTGKAAARVQDAMRAALESLTLDLFTRASMPVEAYTLHRLLGARPDSVYYRRHRGNPLGLDVLVVDEASMADLALMAKLVDALTPRTRLILLGDKDQLASVEAGAVLGDICRSTGYSARFAKRLKTATGLPVSAMSTTDAARPLSDSVALLNSSYRFGHDSGIGQLARLVNGGSGAEALALLQDSRYPDIAWQATGPRELRMQLARSVGEGLREYFAAVHAHEPPEVVFERFSRFRVLCAHRKGAVGVNAINSLIEEILDGEGVISTRSTWYPGRPVMITRNDYTLRLFNGDVGIALEAGRPARMKIFFPPHQGGMRSIAPARLPEHETVYATTIHKSQGSEFGRVLMILPGELSPIMTRELVYTGITRARSGVEIWGSESAFRGAVERRLERGSALHERLW